MKYEALKLADDLDSPNGLAYLSKASDIIRKLAIENEQLKNDISTLSQEHASMRARMERLEAENQSLEDYRYRYESCAK